MCKFPSLSYIVRTLFTCLFYLYFPFRSLILAIARAIHRTSTKSKTKEYALNPPLFLVHFGHVSSLLQLNIEKKKTFTKHHRAKLANREEKKSAMLFVSWICWCFRWIAMAHAYKCIYGCWYKNLTKHWNPCCTSNADNNLFCFTPKNMGYIFKYEISFILIQNNQQRCQKW